MKVFACYEIDGSHLQVNIFVEKWLWTKVVISISKSFFITRPTLIYHAHCFMSWRYRRAWTLLYVVMLQACLDTGYFTRRISFVKVYRLVTTSCVVAGTLKSCRTASPLTFGTRFRFIFGTPFGGYLHARARTGKLFGTGATVSTSGRVVLLWDLDSPQQRR